MDSATTVFIRWQGKPVGPFSLEQLRELIAGGAITAATVTSPDPEGPWTPLERHPLKSHLFSQERTFDRANTNSGPPIDLLDIVAAAQVPKPPPGVRVAPAPAKPVSAEHDVSSLLQFNHEVEKRNGLFKLVPMLARKSRRRRDYFVLLFGIGGLIFVVLLCEAVLAVSLQTMAARMPEQFWPILTQVLFHSPILAFGFASWVFYAAALTWLMFGLMEDY
jgi:hypothetical protein